LFLFPSKKAGGVTQNSRHGTKMATQESNFRKADARCSRMVRQKEAGRVPRQPWKGKVNPNRMVRQIEAEKITTSFHVTCHSPIILIVFVTLQTTLMKRIY
jgi:hypothetical protein